VKKACDKLVACAILLTAGCKASQTATVQPNAIQQTESGFTISNEGFKWTDDENALPFEEVIKKAPFQVKEPEVPFEATNKVAHVIKKLQ
jgi:hypothetical protein